MRDNAFGVLCKWALFPWIAASVWTCMENLLAANAACSTCVTTPMAGADIAGATFVPLGVGLVGVLLLWLLRRTLGRARAEEELFRRAALGRAAKPPDGAEPRPR